MKEAQFTKEDGAERNGDARSSEKRKEQYRKYGEKRRKRPECLLAQKKRLKKWYEENKNKPEYKKQKIKNYKRSQETPEGKHKSMVRSMTRKYIKSGRLERKPCES